MGTNVWSIATMKFNYKSAFYIENIVLIWLVAIFTMSYFFPGRGSLEQMENDLHEKAVIVIGHNPDGYIWQMRYLGGDSLRGKTVVSYQDKDRAMEVYRGIMEVIEQEKGK